MRDVDLAAPTTVVNKDLNEEDTEWCGKGHHPKGDANSAEPSQEEKGETGEDSRKKNL